jgi:hypothetical protein
VAVSWVTYRSSVIRLGNELICECAYYLLRVQNTGFAAARVKVSATRVVDENGRSLCGNVLPFELAWVNQGTDEVPPLIAGLDSKIVVAAISIPTGNMQYGWLELRGKASQPMFINTPQKGERIWIEVVAYDDSGIRDTKCFSMHLDADRYYPSYPTALERPPVVNRWNVAIQRWLPIVAQWKDRALSEMRKFWDNGRHPPGR